MSKVVQNCAGMFSKAAPAADVTKLKPGIALPHVTLPTTEARLAPWFVSHLPLLPCGYFLCSGKAELLQLVPFAWPLPAPGNLAPRL